MSRKKRGLARGREIMLDKVHNLFYKDFSLLFPPFPSFIPLYSSSSLQVLHFVYFFT